MRLNLSLMRESCCVCLSVDGRMGDPSSTMQFRLIYSCIECDLDI